jgi:RNA-binding protein
MKKLKGSQRTYLRGLAHRLKPVIQVGKNGLTGELILAAQEALHVHELIKVKFLNFKEAKPELSRVIEAQTESEMVGLIGNIALFYRPHPEQEKRKIKLP